jgi:hypothetical protein
MSEKHEIKTINELVNICTAETKDTIKEDIGKFIDIMTNIKEVTKINTGRYPRNIVDSIEIEFDGHTGLKTLTIGDETIIQRKDDQEFNVNP